MDKKQDYPFQFFELSNAVTYLSVTAAFFAILAALELGDRNLTGFWIAVSALCDLLDGRYARRFKRTEASQRFGAYLDSFADLVAFGVTPVVSLFRFSLDTMSNSFLLVLWIATGLFYVLATMTRLGFYHLFTAESEIFIGVPTTLAGLAWASLLLMAPTAAITIIGFTVLGALMVSALKIHRPGKNGFIVLILWCAALMIAHGLQYRMVLLR